LLALAEDKHFQVLRTGPYINKVSLGVYNGKDYATLRQNYMLLHGIDTIIINRDNSVTERTASISKNIVRDYADESAPLKSEDQIVALRPENLVTKDDLNLSHDLDRVIQLISS
jgi:hypothetical protein